MSAILRIVPIELAEANAFVDEHHRHHPPVMGHKWSTAVAFADSIVGIAIIGRPVARARDDGWTLEVTRVATIGFGLAAWIWGGATSMLSGWLAIVGAAGMRGTCSALYAAAWRQARERGYRRVGSYILKGDERGTSLLAAGYRLVGEVPGRSWDCPSRPRVDKSPTQAKLRFEIGDTVRSQAVNARTIGEVLAAIEAARAEVA